jgi:hypothetical protein
MQNVRGLASLRERLSSDDPADAELNLLEFLPRYVFH